MRLIEAYGTVRRPSASAGDRQRAARVLMEQAQALLQRDLGLDRGNDSDREDMLQTVMVGLVKRQPRFLKKLDAFSVDHPNGASVEELERVTTEAVTHGVTPEEIHAALDDVCATSELSVTQLDDWIAVGLDGDDAPVRWTLKRALKNARISQLRLETVEVHEEDHGETDLWFQRVLFVFSSLGDPTTEEDWTPADEDGSTALDQLIESFEDARSKENVALVRARLFDVLIPMAGATLKQQRARDAFHDTVAELRQLAAASVTMRQLVEQECAASRVPVSVAELEANRTPRYKRYERARARILATIDGALADALSGAAPRGDVLLLVASRALVDLDLRVIGKHEKGDSNGE